MITLILDRARHRFEIAGSPADLFPAPARGGCGWKPHSQSAGSGGAASRTPPVYTSRVAPPFFPASGRWHPRPIPLRSRTPRSLDWGSARLCGRHFLCSGSPHARPPRFTRSGVCIREERASKGGALRNFLAPPRLLLIVPSIHSLSNLRATARKFSGEWTPKV